MRTLLLIADFACHTGFATVAENIARRLVGWDIHVLAVNYKGDPTPLQSRFQLYPAHLGGDAMGVGRLEYVVPHVKPDVILAINDPWIVRPYIEALSELPHAPPVVAYVPVDGCSPASEHVAPLNGLSHLIAYTQFGLRELRARGLEIAASVIPHGVDLDVFRPLDRAAIRARFHLPPDMFGVLVLDQNQARKRLDIAFDAFARFARDCEQARLIYHGPLKTEMGWGILDMAADLGIGDKLILTGRAITQTNGLRIEDMASVYALADVKLTTTSGEGWGLTTMEAMACGVPCIIPAFGALQEWAGGACLLVTADDPVRHAGGVNTIGRVPRAEDAAGALRHLYEHSGERTYLRQAGRFLVDRDCYRWETIADAFNAILTAVAGGRPVEDREVTWT